MHRPLNLGSAPLTLPRIHNPGVVVSVIVNYYDKRSTIERVVRHLRPEFSRVGTFIAPGAKGGSSKDVRA